MFQALGQRLSTVFDRLKGRGALSESDVDTAMREIRVALLEADVALSVVKTFIADVRDAAVGQDVLRSITPGQMVVKIVHDHLVQILGGSDEPLYLKAIPSVMMVIGLQGSGKTTMTAKLAKHLTEKVGKKVLMASADVYRPAAREQLAILGTQIGVDVLSIEPGDTPVIIARRAHDRARFEGYDVLLFDTAGRLHIDDTLMAELSDLKAILKPSEMLLVADAMTGQDAVRAASDFHAHMDVTGIMLTRLDGDGRGGAALSMRSVTGRPIKFVGTGEHLDKIEPFFPDRIAGRLLGMGDIVSLVEKAGALVDQDQAEKLAKKMGKGTFDLNDLAMQFQQIGQMGGMGSLMGMLPGMGKMTDKMADAGLNDAMTARSLAIIRSMTRQERIDYKIINASRRVRIANGSGVQVSDVNRLLKQFQDMRHMMKRLGKIGEKGLKRGGLSGLLRR